MRSRSTAEDFPVVQWPGLARDVPVAVFLMLTLVWIGAVPSLGEEPIGVDAIEFGANTSDGAWDGACGDLRFEDNPASDRTGMASDPAAGDMFGDASDCYSAYVASTIRLRDRVDGIDFGSDRDAQDYICSDPRFGWIYSIGNQPAMVKQGEKKADATDCRLAYMAAQVGLYDETYRIVFGNNLGHWTSDGECDDPRFRNVPGALEPGMARFLNREGVGRDAADCRKALVAKTIELRPNDHRDGINFGNDRSLWAFDFECDDARFEATDAHPDDAEVRMTQVISANYIGKDATDCRGGYDQNSLRFTVIQELDGIKFGTNSSVFAYNGECDDPRFEDAPGGVAHMASYLAQDDRGADAIDCYRAYRDGDIRLREP